jgi:hypothetical protein
MGIDIMRHAPLIAMFRITLWSQVYFEVTE